MPNICVIHPRISYESAKELADAMGWDICNPFAEERRDFTKYVGVFNYGCNRKIYAHNVINKSKSVAQCIDKVATYKAFKEAGIPTVEYVTRKEDVPKEWDCVVVRKEINGARAEGLDYWYQNERLYNIPAPVLCPDGALYTQYFDHDREYRIMVFLGNLVGCYHKKDNGEGGWDFMPTRITPKFQKMADDAIKAAVALDIDYVGFDVLRNAKGEYKFLEANTGCIITDDMINEIKKYV